MHTDMDNIHQVAYLHSAYVICTYLYLYICTCVCMYWVFIGAVSSPYVYVSFKQLAYIEEDTVSDYLSAKYLHIH